MRQKDFHKITVSEIIRVCGVNRKTFYYHFQDIYALLQWVFEQEAIRVLQDLDLLTDYEDAIRFILNYVQANDYIRSCVHDSVAREEIKRFLYSDLLSLIVSVIEEAERQAGTELEPGFKTYVAKFYTDALASMTIDWVRNGKEEDKETTARYLTNIIAAAVESMMMYMRRS